MSERGVFAVDRGIFSNPRFAPEPFTEREAFQWMVSEAAWKPRRVRVGASVVNLQRGQLAHSLRYMADQWKWSEARVRRFIQRQKTHTPEIDASIDAATDAGITVITIRNYNRYQRVSLPGDAATDAENDAAATQQRRKEKDIKDIKEEEEDGAVTSGPSDSGMEAWQRTPQYRLAKRVADLCGKSEELETTGWGGATERVRKWLAEGWSAELVIASVRHQLATSRRDTGPPKFISYFENGIAEFIARQNRPVPVSESHRGAHEIASKSGFAAIERVFEQFNADQSEVIAGPNEDAVLSLPARSVSRS